jgi:hypothetical protein
LKGIATAAHGTDQVWQWRITCLIKRLAKPAQVNVNRAFFDINTMPPNQIKKLGSAKHLTGPLNQRRCIYCLFLATQALNLSTL